MMFMKKICTKKFSFFLIIFFFFMIPACQILLYLLICKIYMYVIISVNSGSPATCLARLSQSPVHCHDVQARSVTLCE